MDLRQLQRWDPDALDGLGAVLDRHAGELERIGAQITASGRFDGQWSGLAHAAAEQRLDDVTGGIVRRSDAYREVSRCAAWCAPRLRALRAELDDATRWARDRALTVRDDGTVAGGPGTDPERHEAQARIRAVLDRAETLDRRAAADLGRVPDQSPSRPLGFGGVLAAPASTPAVPAPGTAAAQVAAWWAGLDHGERTKVVTLAPELIGNLDGVPAAVRDLANRAQLAGERRRLEEVAARLQAQLDADPLGGLASNADAGLAQTRNKIAALDAIETTLAREDRRLLGLDLSGREAMAAVAVGDVDTADHVTVFTPGAGSTVQGNLAGYDTRMAALREEAMRHLQEAGRAAESVAAVTWLNYQVPQWGWGLARTELSPVSDLAAVRAAPRLAGFLDGLYAERDPHVTAVGHSYGALATGLALQQGVGVDAAVFLGAPGIGTDDVAELGVPPGATYLVEADRDPVGDVGTFDGDPSFLDGVTHLSSDAGADASGRPRLGSTGHSEYLSDGTMSLYNVAAVVGGLPDRVVR